MFSEREIELVRNTWNPVAADRDGSAALFYGRLFQVAPEVIPLFNGDMRSQGRKLMQMIGVAVHNMHRLEELLPALRRLGARHRTYGARPEHYPVVEAALMAMLTEALGHAFTDEAKTAWEKTYRTVATAMLSHR